MICFICGEKKLMPFLNLGNQPPSDAFLRKKDLGKPERTYPLALNFCKTCYLVQLGYVVNPEILFRDYVYTTGMNNSLRANFQRLVDSLVGRFHLSDKDLAIDIGSNDGTLLENYLRYGIKILGIDPSSAAAIAVSKGIPTIVDFFNEAAVSRAKKKYGRAKIITATNVFAHVDKLRSFMRGVKKLLRPDGVFVSESGYLLDLIKDTQYDSIYHEHLRYYSLGSLAKLFGRFGMEIFDAERIPSHNGSIRVYAAKINAYPVSNGVAELAAEERKFGLYKLKKFTEFAEKVSRRQSAFKKLIIDLKSAGARIAGIGAPAKGNTLLNSCGIGKTYIDYLTEKSPLKIGMYAPGTHIPVVAEEKIFSDQPDYALILSWNIATELMKKLRDRGFKGKFIIPFPNPRIVK